MRELRWSWPAVVCLAAGVGCEKPAPVALITEATPVVVASPTPREVTDYEEFTGHTDAIKSVQIKARVSGYLLKKDFQDGQEVKEGDVLYEIDDRPYKTAFESAAAKVAQGDAHRNRLNRDFKRAFNLFERGTIGKQEYDLISSNLAEAEAQLAASRAELETARLNMSFTKLQAPLTGQLSRTLVDPGNLIRQDATILNDIVSTEELYAYFDVSADQMERVSQVINEEKIAGKDGKEVPVEVGTTVDSDTFEDAMRHLRDLQEQANPLNALKKQGKATPDNLKALDDLERQIRREEAQVPPEFPYKGRVNFSENKLDAATGTLRVRGVIKNPAPASILSPGLFVRVRLPIGEPRPALLIPEDSIGSDQGRSYIYIVNARDEVEYRPVVPGAAFGGRGGSKLRAIKQGIAADERFILDSETLRRVRPGARVAPKVVPPTAAELAEANSATVPR